MVYVLKYDKDGWVCRREPYDLGEIDPSIIAGSLEVSDEDFNRSLSAPSHFKWRIVNDEMVLERYEETPESEIKEIRVWELKRFLADSDYKAIKYAEGQITEEEFAPIRTQRQAWRDEINELEKQLNS